MTAVLNSNEIHTSDDTSILLDWLSSQIFPLSGPQELNIPLRIRNIIRNTTDSHIYLPIFQRLLYSLASNLEIQYNGDVMAFFKCLESSTTNLNLIYIFFKFSNNDIILLKRSEFSIYQDFIKSIWDDLITLFSENHKSADLYLVSKILMKINLFDELDNFIFQLSKCRIIQKINTVYDDGPIYDALKMWIVNDLYLSFESLVSFKNSKVFKDCLLLIAKTHLITKRIDQIYELVEKYPATTETLKEFNICLNKTGQKDLLVQHFISTLNRNLLLPSIKTTDIILYYIKTIHALLLIDHRGVLLDKVTRPIRSYLCMRNDTVEKIVNGLLSTDRQNNKLIELNDELNKNLFRSTNSGINVLSSSLQKRTLNWQPDPIDALPDFQVGKIDDIIDSLTSIFNDNNLFINQFVNIFSVDLLNITDYNISNILKNLSLLKSKFSNNDFNKIDIMLNDIVRSKALDSKINHVIKTTYSVHGVFLSHLYWPNLSSNVTMFNFPPAILNDLSAYELRYKSLQSGRSLKFHPQNTKASIDIEFNGIKKNYVVTLDKLAVLNFINDSNLEIVKLGIIVMKLSMPLQLVKSSLEFWVAENVLIEESGGWKVNE